MFLVTGGNGQLGRQIVERLLDRVPAAEIAVSVREPAKAADLAELGISVRHGDFDHPEGLAEAFAGAGRMVLVSSNGLPHEVRYQHHVRAAEAAEAAGITDIVYTSLAVALPPCISEVHRRTEEAIADTGLRYSFMRHPLYTDSFVNVTDGEVELVTATGSGRVATAWRSDLAEAAAVVLAAGPSENRAFDLTGPDAWSYDELALFLSGRAGHEIRHEPVPSAEFAKQLEAEEVPEFLVRILVDIHTWIAEGRVAAVTGDLERLLGRRPRRFNE